MMQETSQPPYSYDLQPLNPPTEVKPKRKKLTSVLFFQKSKKKASSSNARPSTGSPSMVTMTPNYGHGHQIHSDRYVGFTPHPTQPASPFYFLNNSPPATTASANNSHIFYSQTHNATSPSTGDDAIRSTHYFGATPYPTQPVPAFNPLDYSSTITITNGNSPRVIISQTVNATSPTAGGGFIDERYSFSFNQSTRRRTRPVHNGSVAITRTNGSVSRVNHGFPI